MGLYALIEEFKEFTTLEDEIFSYEEEDQKQISEMLGKYY